VVLLLVVYAAITFAITVSFLGDYPIYGWFYGM